MSYFTGSVHCSKQNNDGTCFLIDSLFLDWGSSPEPGGGTHKFRDECAIMDATGVFNRGATVF